MKENTANAWQFGDENDNEHNYIDHCYVWRLNENWEVWRNGNEKKTHTPCSQTLFPVCISTVGLQIQIECDIKREKNVLNDNDNWSFWRFFFKQREFNHWINDQSISRMCVIRSQIFIFFCWKKNSKMHTRCRIWNSK